MEDTFIIVTTYIHTLIESLTSYQSFLPMTVTGLK
jgi:hypothetical protein